MLPCPVQVSRSHGNACRTCSHTARNHPYRLSLELRLVSVVHRRIANAEHFLAGEPRTIVVVQPLHGLSVQGEVLLILSDRIEIPQAKFRLIVFHVFPFSRMLLTNMVSNI